MFIGIGTLIVARHPALHSLAEVTIAGMFSVVLMAYLFPPLIFNFLVKKNGKYRERPLSVSLLFRRKAEMSTLKYCHDLVLDRYRYKGVEVFGTVKRNLKHYHDYEEWMGLQDTNHPVIIQPAGYGEKALLFALMHPGAEVVAVEADAEKCDLLRYSAKGIVTNLRVVQTMEVSS